MTVLPEPGQTTADPVAMAAVAPSPLDTMPSAASAAAEVVPALATQPETLPEKGAK